jgi:hypothetical protein
MAGRPKPPGAVQPGADIPNTLRRSVGKREDFSYLRTASMRWIDRPRHERG